MKKVVILGCENSHANTFLNFIKEGGYPEIEITGVYSHDPAAAEKLGDQYGVKVMRSYDEAVGQTDGVIVTARHGDNHFPYAEPYIRGGMTLFIDKPVTIDEGEAVAMMRRFRGAGVRFTGGSCCKYMDFIQKMKQDHLSEEGGKTVGGFVRAPVSLNNDYGNFFFYSQHLVEMVCEAFGYSPVSVRAFEKNGCVTVIFRYQDFDVTGLFVDGSYQYYAARFAMKRSDGAELKADTPCFRAEFDEFYRLLCGGEQVMSHETFIAPVFILNAIDRALTSGREEMVGEIEI